MVSNSTLKTIKLFVFLLLVLAVNKNAVAADILVPADHPAIQDAIDAASAGDTILVSPGRYYENITFNKKDIILKSVSGPGSTIIDGDGAGSVVTFYPGVGASSVLEGFTITNGNAHLGGGITLESSSPTISGCIITGNSASNGGGIYCTHSSSPTITNCTITANKAKNGGGVYCTYSSSPMIINSAIAHNSAKNGGGIYCEHSSSPTLINCNLNNNTAIIGGGIYSIDSSSPTLTTCTLLDNYASWFGNWIFYFNSSPMISNSNINGTVSDYGDDIYSYFLRLKNIIKTNNSIVKLSITCLIIFQMFFLKLYLFSFLR